MECLANYLKNGVIGNKMEASFDIDIFLIDSDSDSAFHEL